MKIDTYYASVIDLFEDLVAVQLDISMYSLNFI